MSEKESRHRLVACHIQDTKEIISVLDILTLRQILVGTHREVSASN